MDWLDYDWQQLDGWKKNELKDEINRLRDAIRKHRDEKGHDRCWLDDQELYSVLPETIPGDLTLPPKEEFIQNCHRYWEHRQDPSVTFIRQKDLDQGTLGPITAKEASRIARKAGIIDKNGNLTARYREEPTEEADDKLNEVYNLPHSD